ncbi:MAG: allantoicase [Gammaproteobacteria bacterium]|nr:allantoicase [Gammaproteobacteria bacterium]
MSTDIEQNRLSMRYVNLAHPRLGAKTLFSTDEFFAPSERMLNPEPALFVPGKFDDNGKWMDGWESRRKRVEGYDYCIVKLGRPGVIHGFDIDTSHFKGNHPPAASVDACYLTNGDPDQQTQWTEILPSVSLQQDSHHLFDLVNEGTYSHLRLNIYPDGGIARFRVYGTPQCDWNSRGSEEVLDLAALENGGRAMACSNQAFGSSILNLTMPGRGINMGDGWETARRREPGNEWAIIALGHPGIIESIELDTAHYKGNYPDRASIQGSYMQGGTEDSIVTQSMFWKEILPEQKLKMDHIHLFQSELNDIGPITHVRVNIIPDGGLSRVRLNGRIVK